LGKTVHATANFHIYGAIVEKWFEVIAGDNVDGEEANGDAHIFEAVHRCAKVKIFDVAYHATGVGCREHTVEK